MSAVSKKKKKRSKRNPLLIPLIVLCTLIIALSAFYIYHYYSFKIETERQNQALALMYQEKEAELSRLITPEPTNEPQLQEAPDSDTIIIPYPTKPAGYAPEFAELYEINNDLIGFLSIPLKTVTPIELPVVQRDNEFYLNHNFYGEESKSGSAFLDQANEIWPQDQHLIIYGHNMKNGTMFARLSRYHTLDYAKYNPIVYFDSLYEKGTYAVLAALQLPAKELVTDGFNLRTFVFGDVSFNAFMYSLSQRALYVTNVGAEPGDQLLTLVTCSYDEDDERLVLITRRLREGETEDDIHRIIK